MKFTLTIAGMVLLTPFVYASDAGTTSANFLKLGAGPRAIAMGEAQIAVADDSYATYWNPAGLAQLTVPEAGFVYTQYVENINTQYATYAYPHPRLGTFAGSVTYLTVGKFQGYDAVGQPTDSIGASDTAIGASYGRFLYRDRRLGSNLAWGATGKYIQERLDTVNARTLAGDLGLLYSAGKRWGDWLDGFKAGLTLRNAGGGLKYDTESFPLPLTLAAGLSYEGTVWTQPFLLAIDGRKGRDGVASFGSGFEFWALHTLAVRLGYTSQGDLGNGLRVGTGIKLSALQFDYAYAGLGAFGGTHRFGITFQFGRPAEDPLYVANTWVTKGQRDYRHKRYTEALVEFNKALEIDPSNPDALEMMKKTYERIKTTAPVE